MNPPDYFEMREQHAVFRPGGQVSLGQAVQMVTSAITFAREQKCTKLLVITSDLTGFASPSVVARYNFIQEWARASRGFVRIAFVARPEMIDPEKFGITVAANNGLVSDVFDSEEKAWAWLHEK